MQNLQTATTNNNNWGLTTLGEVGEIITGNTPSTSNPKYYNEKYLPWVTPPDLSAGGRITDARRYISREGAKVARVLPKDSVLISCIGNLGKVGIAGRELATNQQINSIIFNEGILPEYGFYYCQTLKRWLEENSSNTTISIVNKGRLEKAPFVKTNKLTQQKLIDKLNIYFPEVSKANGQIQRVKLLIHKFRQAVLSAAVTGKLTEGWREKNPNRQTAEEIISVIHKRRLGQAKTGTIKKKVESIYSTQEENDSENLPEGWEHTSLNKLCESFEYGSSKKSSRQGRVAVLRMGNLQDKEIDWNNLVFTSDEEEISKYQLKPNTVLFNRTNSPELVGKTSIYRGERPAIFAGYLIRINNYPELDSEYLNIYLNSYLAKEFCRQVKTDGVSQSNINAQKLGKFEIPFCSVEEQKEIAKRVKSLLTVADEIEDNVNKAASRVEKLTQSILGKAFKGELFL